MANVNKGEMELTVNDSVYTLVLTLDDLEAIEETLSSGATELLNHLVEGKARSKDISTVLKRALRNVRPRLQPPEVEIVLKEIPFQSRYAAVTRLVAGALNLLDEQREQTEEQRSDEPEPEKKKGGESSERPLSLARAV